MIDDGQDIILIDSISREVDLAIVLDSRGDTGKGDGSLEDAH